MLKEGISKGQAGRLLQEEEDLLLYYLSTEVSALPPLLCRLINVSITSSLLWMLTVPLLPSSPLLLFFCFVAKQFHCQWTAILSTPVPTKGAGKGMQTTLTGSSIRTANETMVDTVQTRSGKFGKTPIRMTSEVRRFGIGLRKGSAL